MTDRPAVLVQSRADLRAWLSLDHAAGQPVWLIRHKPPHPNQLQHDEMVAELIGWGWVDSQPKSIDDARCANLIAPPRNPKSAWSQVNKAPATQSRVTHLMTPAGDAAVARAQTNGMWDFLNDVETLHVPPDLAAASDDRARTTWDAHPRTIKRAALEWIKTAKTAGTRAARIAEVASSPAEGLRPKPFRR